MTKVKMSLSAVLAFRKGRWIMRRLKITFLLSICLLLAACGRGNAEDTKTVKEAVSGQVAEKSLDITEVQNTEERLIQVMVSYLESSGYINAHNHQILATDTKSGLDAVVMTFRDQTNRELIINAVLKQDQVMTSQTSDIGTDAFLDYRTIGTDTELGDYTLYSGIVRDNKVTNLNFVYDNGTIVNTKLSDQKGYCYLLLKKEVNNKDISRIQEMDENGNIIYEMKEDTKATEETTIVGVEKDGSSNIETEAMTAIKGYYDFMYSAYEQGSVNEELFGTVLDMTQVQNKNKLTAMKKINMNWEYFRTMYPNYCPTASPVSLHLESLMKQDNGTYEVIIDIDGGKNVADYPPSDYLVGLKENTESMDVTEFRFPPFVSLGENVFVLQDYSGHMLIQKHIYEGQEAFEGLDTVENIFDPVEYGAILQEERWGQTK